mmetsp:Transcript_27718/g.46926  ORF Transcript_27718/g.46926 Transcript_27718/m.46926 type:complete len:211 (-) Transcript_27718:256-888(-)
MFRSMLLMSSKIVGIGDLYPFTRVLVQSWGGRPNVALRAFCHSSGTDFLRTVPPSMAMEALIVTEVMLSSRCPCKIIDKVVQIMCQRDQKPSASRSHPPHPSPDKMFINIPALLVSRSNIVPTDACGTKCPSAVARPILFSTLFLFNFMFSNRSRSLSSLPTTDETHSRFIFHKRYVHVRIGFGNILHCFDSQKQAWLINRDRCLIYSPN